MRTIHNVNKRRFDLYDETGAHLGEIEYINDGDNTLFATHTEVFGGPGKGYATILLDALAEYAQNKHAKIVPVCGFVKGAFQHHPEKYDAVIAH